MERYTNIVPYSTDCQTIKHKYACLTVGLDELFAKVHTKERRGDGVPGGSVFFGSTPVIRPALLEAFVYVLSINKLKRWSTVSKTQQKNSIQGRTSTQHVEIPRLVVNLKDIWPTSPSFSDRKDLYNKQLKHYLAIQYA